MSTQPRPTFGKRVSPAVAAAALATPAAASHTEPAVGPASAPVDWDWGEPHPVVVRDSLLAAVFAGIVVGLFLACLDIAGIGQTFRPIGDLLAQDPRAGALLPFMIQFGLMGGSKAAGTTFLIGHPILKRLGQTNLLAYALGGALAAAAYVLVMHVLLGAGNTHGLLIDGVAGAVCGMLYRIFAGTEEA